MNHTPEGPVLPAIERDESFEREYIPLPGGWEVHTKGKGSTFRIVGPTCIGEGGKLEMERFAVMDEHLHEPLTMMARSIREASLAMYAQGKAEGGEAVAWQSRLSALYRKKGGVEDDGWDFPSIAFPKAKIDHPCWEVRALYAHPAKAVDVDDAMVERAWNAYDKFTGDGDCSFPAMRAALTAALEAKP